MPVAESPDAHIAPSGRPPADGESLATLPLKRRLSLRRLAQHAQGVGRLVQAETDLWLKED